MARDGRCGPHGRIVRKRQGCAALSLFGGSTLDYGPVLYGHLEDVDLPRVRPGNTDGAIFGAVRMARWKVKEAFVGDGENPGARDGSE